MSCCGNEKPVCPPASETPEPQNVPECPNTPVTPVGIPGPLVARIPVVLAEATISTNISTVINFPNPVLEIKRIKKSLKIVQCHLVPGTNQLFLEGFVRKNIQFATPVGRCGNAVTSNIQSLTLDVPFTCSTMLTFAIAPANLIPSTTTEFEFGTSIPLPIGNPPSESLLGQNLGFFNQVNTEFFNGLPFCSLVSDTITESDEALDRTPLRRGPFEEGTFTKVREKMLVTFTIKILQNRQVTIP
jgi:hypothetical protein